MRKIVNCGKIDWNNSGRKINSVELELELSEQNGHWCFSCCCSVWNSRKSDILAGGQCLDEVFKYDELRPYVEIYELWKKHHRNDMHAGSPKQEEMIKAWKTSNNRPYDYDMICEMLDEAGLLVDKSYIHKGKPYKYGTAWLIREIPEDDLLKIRKWMS